MGSSKGGLAGMDVQAPDGTGSDTMCCGCEYLEKACADDSFGFCSLPGTCRGEL